MNVISTGSGVLFRRIASNKATRRPAWCGASAPPCSSRTASISSLCGEGRETVPEPHRDPGNLWVGTNIQVVTINRNSKAIPDADAPKRWEDLLDARWKGASPTPIRQFRVFLRGRDRPAAGVGRQRRGVAEIRQTGRQYQGVEPLDAGIRWQRQRRISAGDFAGVRELSVGAQRARRRVIGYPADGTVALAEGAAIIKGGPDPETPRS